MNRARSNQTSAAVSLEGGADRTSSSAHYAGHEPTEVSELGERQREMRSRLLALKQRTATELNTKTSSELKTMSPALQQHYTCAELSKLWGISQSTLLRIFKSEPGVLRIGNLKSRKRTKISIRIPLEVVERVWQQLTR
jgi:hypothetical protein